jgi:hypothetical protein
VRKPDVLETPGTCRTDAPTHAKLDTCGSRPWSAIVRYGVPYLTNTTDAISR